MSKVVYKIKTKERRIMSTRVFWRTVIAGFFATFTMQMIAFLQSGFGLPLIDIGHFLKETFNHIHQSDVYSILWGNAAYQVIGIILALVWVAFLQQRVPGNWLVQGALYGVLTSTVHAVAASPLVFSAAGDSFGLFYSQTCPPGRMLLAGLIMHLGYGIVLMLGLRYAGVEGIE
jgi:magnesium-transporting ATPase (P-type)